MPKARQHTRLLRGVNTSVLLEIDKKYFNIEPDTGKVFTVHSSTNSERDSIPFYGRSCDFPSSFLISQ